MSPEFQTGVAIGIVVIALAALVRRWTRSTGSGCGGGCDCAAKPTAPNRRP